MNTDCMCGIGIGEEPYRQLGVAVNEAEMLDATAMSQVARAKNVYSREYRAVSLHTSTSYFLAALHTNVVQLVQQYLSTSGTILLLMLSTDNLSLRENTYV